MHRHAQRAAPAKDAGGLALDQGHLVLVGSVEGHDLALGLRDDLAGDHDEVVAGEGLAAGAERVEKERDEVVAFADRSDAAQGNHAKLVHDSTASPRRRAFSGDDMMVVVTCTLIPRSRTAVASSASAWSITSVPMSPR